MSTISQLGYMVMAIGLSQYNVALMHTLNHAFFKALLFLGAGAVIHSFSDELILVKVFKNKHKDKIINNNLALNNRLYSTLSKINSIKLKPSFITGFTDADSLIKLSIRQINLKVHIKNTDLNLVK
jgi:NADH:ubiquinone oxidoreductase subunit 5 (subunit L)/multisubunit Na+/H+ antiporter MnhA subunit